jgi:hypothetical protein
MSQILKMQQYLSQEMQPFPLEMHSKHEVLHLLEETSKGFLKDVMRLQISGYVTLLLVILQVWKIVLFLD